MDKFKIVTLCSGYDSQCLALEYLKQDIPNFDYELVAWSEIDKNAILAHNILFPQYSNRNLGDMRYIDWPNVEDFDVLFYSTPCQDFSIAGYNIGGYEGSGSRSSLLWYTRNAVLAKMPKVLIMENVKNILSYAHIGVFKKWVNELTSYGYKTYYRVINAADYGVPQDRNRLIAISFLMPDKEFTWPAKVQTKKLIDYLDDIWDYSIEVKKFSEQMSYDSAIQAYIDNYYYNGDKQLLDGGTITYSGTDKGLSNTLTTVVHRNDIRRLLSKSHYPEVGIIKLQDGVISLRGLNSRERYRLMGVKEQDISKLLAQISSKSTHASLTGNSIVVDMLYYIFKQIIMQNIQSLL